MNNNLSRLSHTTWNCKYHIVFAPKYSIGSVMGYIKGKSSLLIYERWKNMEYKYKNREFWCRGYYVDTVGKNAKRIAEYIQNQLKIDEAGSQLPFDKSPLVVKERK